MSSATSSDMVETDVESTRQVQPVTMPQVTLSFDNSTGGAWDDRELIRAYDAALDEFHVHHPGPGSWLDKMTAALKKGQPLEGAEPTSTSWYSASAKAPEPIASTSAQIQNAQSGPSQPATKRRKTSRQAAVARTAATNPYDPISYPAPSTTATASRTNGNAEGRARFQASGSPSYTPPSPSVHVGDAGGLFADDDALEDDFDSEDADDDEEDEDEAEWYDESYALSQHPHQPPADPALAQPEQSAHAGIAMGMYPPPTYAGHSPAEVGTFEAMGYAMSAQYWAGYWMGLAQAKAAAPAAITSAVPPGAGSSSTKTLVRRPTKSAKKSGGRVVRERGIARRSGRVGAAVNEADRTGYGNVVNGNGGSGTIANAAEGRPSNVFVTRKQFGQPSASGVINGLNR